MKSESRPAVSIIVPVYKAEAYLHYCVDSLLGQTFRDIEVLLVDDGSPDQSGAICDQYACEDDRVRVFHIENGGVSRARNYALRHVRGRYIAFCDSDDAFRLNTIEVCMKYVREYGLDFFQFNFSPTEQPENRNLEVHCGLSPFEYIGGRHYMLGVWGSFIKREAVDGLYFDETMRYAEDQLFLFRAMVRCSKLGSTNQDLYFYRQNEGSAMHNLSAAELLHSCDPLIQAMDGNELFARQFCKTIYSHLYFAAIERGVNRKRFVEIARKVGYRYLNDSPRSIIFFMWLLRINVGLAILSARICEKLLHKKSHL